MKLLAMKVFQRKVLITLMIAFIVLTNSPLTYSYESVEEFSYEAIKPNILTNNIGAINTYIKKYNYKSNCLSEEQSLFYRGNKNSYIVSNENELTIINQPESDTICVNETTSLTIEVSGSGNSFQWYKEGIEIPGANAATLSDISSEGNYYCKVWNSDDTVISNTVNVYKPYIADISDTTDIRIYQESFQSDPDFTSMAPDYAYWDTDQGNYYVKTYDNEQHQYWGYSPQFSEFNSSNDILLELDMLCENKDWGTYPGVHFYGEEPTDISNDSRTLSVRFVWSDGNWKKISISDNSGNVYNSSNQFQDNKWYHVKIDFKSETQKADIIITEKSSGSVFYEQNNIDLDLNSFSWMGVGYYGPSDYGNEWAPIRIDDLFFESPEASALDISVSNDTVVQSEHSAIHLHHTQQGINYQLLNNGVPVSESLSGNGATISFDNLMPDITSLYEIEATDTLTGCSIVLDTLIQITVVNQQQLFYEDWEEGIRDTVWKSWGSPLPEIIEGGGYNNSDGFDPNGDGWHHSGVCTYQNFDLTKRPSVSFWGKGINSVSYWQIFTVAWSLSTAENYNGDGNIPGMLARIVVAPATNENYNISYQARNSSGDMISHEETWDPGYDDVWMKYEMNINSDSTISFYRDGVMMWTTPFSINTSEYQEQALHVSGRSSGSDKQIVDNIEVTTQQNIDPSHFAPVWEGNAYQPMTFMIGGAGLEGTQIEAGDEIGIFDGEQCVGAGILTQSLDPDNNEDLIAVVASKDDGSGNGYTEGNTITYRIWDSSEEEEFEVTTVAFPYEPEYTFEYYSALETNFVVLAAQSSVEQETTYLQGWNMVSFAVEPEDNDMQAIFQPLIDNGHLVKVIDESGNIMEEMAWDWVNNIGSMSPTEGYYTKVSVGDTLITTGTEVELPFDIPLTSGWNIIGYPFMASQAASQVLSQLMEENVLIKVINQEGNFLENMPWGWMDNIGTFNPGEGYYVKVNQNSTLTIQEPLNQKSNLPASYKAPKARHFNTAFTGNPYQPMQVVVKTSELDLQDGDELALYSNEVCVGAAGYKTNSTYQYLTAAKDDPATTEQDGYMEGEKVSLKVFRKEINAIYPLTYELIKGPQTYSALATMLIKANSILSGVDDLNDKEIKLSQNRPNPWSEETVINFELSHKGKVSLSVFNIQGLKISTLINQIMETGSHSVTLNRDDYDTGIYIYKLTFENGRAGQKQVLYNKMVISE